MKYLIERTTTENINFKNLELKLDSELFEIYGDMQNNYTAHNNVKDLKTIIIFDEDNPIGCGCLKVLKENLGEVKRVFVASDNRGKGIAKLIVEEIQKLAIENNIKNLILQTGSKQHAAINLYKKMGYTMIERYGPYVNDNNSVCMGILLNY